MQFNGCSFSCYLLQTTGEKNFAECLILLAEIREVQIFLNFAKQGFPIFAIHCHVNWRKWYNTSRERCRGMSTSENQIVVYQPNETVLLDVRLENEM